MTIGYVKTSAPALPLLTASEVIALNPNVMFPVPFEAPPGCDFSTIASNCAGVLSLLREVTVALSC